MTDQSVSRRLARIKFNIGLFANPSWSGKAAYLEEQVYDDISWLLGQFDEVQQRADNCGQYVESKLDAAGEGGAKRLLELQETIRQQSTWIFDLRQRANRAEAALKPFTVLRSAEYVPWRDHSVCIYCRCTFDNEVPEHHTADCPITIAREVLK